MSALGQKQTYAPQKAMSALPPIATAKADSRKSSCLLYPRKRTLCCSKATPKVRPGGGHLQISKVQSCGARRSPIETYFHKNPYVKCQKCPSIKGYKTKWECAELTHHRSRLQCEVVRARNSSIRGMHLVCPVPKRSSASSRHFLVLPACSPV